MANPNKGKDATQQGRQSQRQQQGGQSTTSPQTPASQAGQTGGRENQQQQQTGMARRGEQTAGMSRQPRGLGMPSLLTGSPFTFMRRFSEEMDRLFEDFNVGGSSQGRGLISRGGGSNQTPWAPQIEVFERGDQLIIRADLPGMNKGDVQVEMTDDAIIIQGERRQEREEAEEDYYHSERSYGSFRRSIPLPEGIDAENARATFRNGVLEVTMQEPKRESRSRQLDIEDSNEEAEPLRSRAQAAGK